MRIFMQRWVSIERTCREVMHSIQDSGAIRGKSFVRRFFSLYTVVFIVFFIVIIIVFIIVLFCFLFHIAFFFYQTVGGHFLQK